MKYPTFIQFVGGFGKLTAFEWAKVHSGWWGASTETDSFRLGHLDSDPAGAEHFGPGEFYRLGGVPLREILSQMQSDRHAFPYLRKRLGDLNQLNQTLGTDIVTEGAECSRPIALATLAFHLERNREELLGFLTKPIREIFAFPDVTFSAGKRNGGQNLPLALPVVGSLCGGQNSGIFNDLAFLNHYLLRVWGIREYYPSAILALPDVYWQVEQGRLRANTAAALKELLHHYANIGLPDLQYGKGLQVRRDKPPFMFIYLVSGTNTRGRTFNQPEQVAQVVAQSLRMMSAGRIAEHYRALLQNILRDLRHPYLASSLGCYVMEVPVGELKRLFAHRLMRRMVKAHLLREMSDQDEWAKLTLTDFLHEAKLTTGPGQFFQRDREGRPIGVNMAPFKRLKGKILQRALAAYHTEQLPKWEKALDEMMDRGTEAIGTVLDERVVTLVNAEGLSQAMAFLQAMERWIEEIGERLRKAGQQVQEQTSRFQARRGRRRFKLPFFPNRRLRKQKEREMGLALLSFKVSAQIKLLARLRGKVAEWVSEAQGWMDALHTLEVDLHQKERGFARERWVQRPVVVENVLSDEEEERLYEESMDNALALASQSLTFRRETEDLILVCRQGAEAAEGHHAWLLSEEGQGQQLKYAESFWQHLEQISLEDILQQRQANPEELIDYLEERAAPLIVVDPLKQARPVIIRKVLGTEKGSAGLFRSVPGRANLSLVETNHPHRLEMLITYHGISPLALVQSDDLEQAYQALHGEEPLHVFPEGELQVDHSEAIFYRLLGYDRVRRIGEDLYALEFEARGGVQLEAQDIKELVSLFCMRPDLIERATGFIRQREEALDPQASATMLRDNARALAIPDFPELEKKARAEIRRYATTVRHQAGRKVTI